MTETQPVVSAGPPPPPLPPPPPPVEQPPRTRFRDRVFGLWAVAAVGIAGVVLGGLGGVAVHAATDGGGDTGRGGQQGRFGPGQGGPQGGFPGGGPQQGQQQNQPGQQPTNT